MNRHRLDKMHDRLQQAGLVKVKQLPAPEGYPYLQPDGYRYWLSEADYHYHQQIDILTYFQEWLKVRDATSVENPNQPMPKLPKAVMEEIMDRLYMRDHEDKLELDQFKHIH